MGSSRLQRGQVLPSIPSSVTGPADIPEARLCVGQVERALGGCVDPAEDPDAVVHLDAQDAGAADLLALADRERAGRPACSAR